MSWILVAGGVALAGGGASAITANQNRQKQKGVIGRAYDIAKQRQAIGQRDVRQSTAEGAGARGLAGAGDVNAGSGNGVAPLTTPSVGGAHTLGGQQGVDLAREQSLESQNLENEKAGTLADINAAANAQEVAGIAGGIEGAASAGVAAGTLKSGSTVSPIAAAYGSSTPAPVGPTTSPYGNSSAFGVDPVNPLGRGAWSAPSTTGGFNKFSLDNGNQ